MRTSTLTPRWLSTYSLFVAVATFVLIIAGGLVTSHEAGLAVPDWPLSYGQLFPPMVGNIFWEHGHRMIAGSVGILTLALALFVQRFEPRPAIKKLAWIAVALVIAQAVLGGLTVIFLLPAPVSIAHAALAQTFFCVIVSLAYFLNSSEVPPKEDGALRARRLLLTTTVLIYAQLVLGATLRHTGQALAVHIVVAFLVLIHVGRSVRRVQLPAAGAPQKIAVAWGGLTVLQFFLGLGSLVFTRMIERGYAPSIGEVFFTVAHQSTGALILAGSVLLTVMLWRRS